MSVATPSVMGAGQGEGVPTAGKEPYVQHCRFTLTSSRQPGQKQKLLLLYFLVYNKHSNFLQLKFWEKIAYLICKKIQYF